MEYRANVPGKMVHPPSTVRVRPKRTRATAGVTATDPFTTFSDMGTKTRLEPPDVASVREALDGILSAAEVEANATLEQAGAESEEIASDAVEVLRAEQRRIETASHVVERAAVTAIEALAAASEELTAYSARRPELPDWGSIQAEARELGLPRPVEASHVGR